MRRDDLPKGLASNEDKRVWDVLCVGIAVGVVVWGAVGAWTAITVGNYPWNKWIPFANGARVALPAVVCAAVLALLTALPYRRGQSVASSVTLLLAGIGLLLLPRIASDLAPEIQGNGRHANEDIWAILRCWIVGIPVLLAGLLRSAFFLVNLGHGGQREEALPGSSRLTSD
ncbi:hypothetical protein [Nonomuraea fuscirosea]|uniref:hypothetical protein n=1 Tax=Nonomuraea fuscirosea TaxID=1291556 RepID=UPI00341D2C5A